MEGSDDEKDGTTEASIPKELGHSSEPKGTKFVDEVLKGPNESCLENFRMDKQVFYKLCDMLRTRGLLHHTNRIKIEEQLAIFMFIVGHNLRTRAVQELFKYSGETISRHFNNVLSAIMAVSLDFFQPPNSNIPPAIREDPRLYPYFMVRDRQLNSNNYEFSFAMHHVLFTMTFNKNCVGTVEGIHFPVTIGVDEQGPFQNKNGFLSQNVLAACSFDMKFHYVLAGWEGSAPDMRVLNSALTRRNKLEVPDGKYYLVDPKYANMQGFIAPYPGVSYSQLEFGGGLHPQDARELFNQRHSVLHNVAGRTFAALKERFPILMSAPSYPLATQVKLIVAACALHNYIRDEKPDDWLFKMYDQEAAIQVEDPMPPLEHEHPLIPAYTEISCIPVGAEELEHGSQVRDAIATEIWNDYVRDYAAIDDVL